MPPELSVAGVALPRAWLAADACPWDKWLADNHELSASQAVSKANHFSAFLKPSWSYSSVCSSPRVRACVWVVGTSCT